MHLMERESPELLARLRVASSMRLRNACLTACEFAMRRAGVEHPLVADSLARLRRGEELTSETRAAIRSLVDELDDEYFGLKEEAEREKLGDTAYMKAFSRARAVAALAEASGDDVFQAATESIYEAAFAVEDKEELFTLLRDALD
jgi:hypothetical protein